MTQMIDLFGGNSGVAGVDAYGKNVANAAGLAASATGQAGMRMNDLYFNQYQPYDQKLMNVVDNMGTEAYRAQQRGQAMTGVQQQADAARQQQARKMAAMGVNPNSGAFAAMNGAMNQNLALGKVGAAMAADRGARDEYKQGLGAINAMGMKLSEAGQKNMAVSADMGRVGLMGADVGSAALDRQTNAGASATSAGAAAMNASTNAAKVAQDGDQFNRTFERSGDQFNRTLASQNAQFDKTYGINLGKLALDREALTTGNYFKQQGIDTEADKNSFGNVALNTVLAAGTKWALTPDGMTTIGNGFDWLTGKLFGGSSGGSASTPQLTA